MLRSSNAPTSSPTSAPAPVSECVSKTEDMNRACSNSTMWPTCGPSYNGCVQGNFSAASCKSYKNWCNKQTDAQYCSGTLGKIQERDYQYHGLVVYQMYVITVVIPLPKRSAAKKILLLLLLLVRILEKGGKVSIIFPVIIVILQHARASRHAARILIFQLIIN